MINKKQVIIIVSIVILILLIEIVSSISDSVYVNVVESREFVIDFVALDEKTSSFEESIKDSIRFINSTYPIPDEKLITETNPDIFHSSIGENLEEDELYPLLKDIYKMGRLSGSTDRVVGIAPEGWFVDHGFDAKGISYIWKPLFGVIIPLNYAVLGVIVEEDIRHGAAHEIGHTFKFCEEYNSTMWDEGNIFLNECPNGDLDGNGSLDDICLEYPEGCPITTIGSLIPWLSTDNSVNLYNFMGDASEEDYRWIDNVSYMHLLDTFSSDLAFLSVDYGILISGNLIGDLVFIDDYSYILYEKKIYNQSSGGNYSVIVEEDGSILSEMSFDPSFYIMSIGGDMIEVNTISFAFVLPFSNNVTRIYIEKNNITKAEINRSLNTPSLTITSNLSNQTFTGELFNLTWNSSDLDNDTVVYAILFSSDNGGNYTTLEIDYNQTTLELNSSDLPDCTSCKLKILVTDGINTNSSVSDTFTISINPIITSLIDINEADVIDGDILVEENVTFNATITDNSQVESVWLKIWSGVTEISNVIWQSFLSFVSGDVWTTEIQTNESFPIGDVNYTIYANDTSGNEVNQSGSFKTILPNDTHKFYIKNNNDPVAWLGSEGNVVLEGSCFIGTCETPEDNSLVIRNSTKGSIAFINSSGDMCVSSGDCSDESEQCDNPTDALAMRNQSKDVVSYLNGSLCLTGKLYENTNIG